MARGRMIAATVADDKRFNELPVDAALVYLMAIPQLDRDGLILGEPTVLWGQVCRRRVDLIPRMADIIAAWIAAELVTAYKTEDGDTILYFTGFQKNQAMTHYDREAASRFPCPPGYERTAKGLIPEPVKQELKPTADEVRTNSGPTPDEVPPNVMESKVSESECERTATAFTDSYKRFWALMPASEYETGKIKDWAERVPLEAWEYALKECVDSRNTGQWKYFESILRRVEKEGLQKPKPVLPPTANGTVPNFDFSALVGG